MEVIFVCPVTETVLVKEGSDLPEGWVMPPGHIALDEEKEILPFGVVLALSSKQACDKLLKERLFG